jgi:hypothetical protein
MYHNHWKDHRSNQQLKLSNDVDGAAEREKCCWQAESPSRMGMVRYTSGRDNVFDRNNHGSVQWLGSSPAGAPDQRLEQNDSGSRAILEAAKCLSGYARSE